MTGMSLFKLGDRRGASARGLSCNRDGVFLGEFALVKAATDTRGRRVYRARSLGEINAALSAAYGREVEFKSRLPGLRQAARYLAENKLALAQIAAVQLRLPDLPDDAAALRLRKAETLLRFNPNHRGSGPRRRAIHLGRRQRQRRGSQDEFIKRSHRARTRQRQPPPRRQRDAGSGE